MSRLPHLVHTEAEGAAALETSYQMMAPLGVPTLIIDPADYDPRLSLWGMRGQDTIEDDLKARMQDVLHNFYGADHPQVRQFMDVPNPFWLTLVNKLAYCVQTSQMVAHSLASEKFFNVVICPRTNDTGALLLKHGLKMPEQNIPDVPGTNIEWNFIRLWHEFGHGLKGTSEAAADWVSAVVHRHVFPDPQALMVLSDFRAACAMFNHSNAALLSARGWSLVDTLDCAINDIEAPASWHQVGTHIDSPHPTDNSAADVAHIGQHLRGICKLAFAEPDLLMLGMMADHMAYKGNVENENQLRIARRFAIAAQRLSIGRHAYAVTTPKHSI